MTDVTSIELTTTRYDEIKEAMFMQHVEINNLRALVRHYEKTINILTGRLMEQGEVLIDPDDVGKVTTESE